MRQKNIYFHKFHIYQEYIEKNNGSDDLFKRDYLDSDKKNDVIKNIVDQLPKSKTLRLVDEKSEKTLEFLKMEKEYIFARIGRYQESHTFHLRDKENLSAQAIEKKKNQELEVFTYLLIDRETYIVSFLKEQAAPSIQSLKYLIDNNCPNLTGSISGIVVEDAIPLLAKKDIIGTIEYNMTVPTETFLSIEKLGLSEEEYLKLTNQKHVALNVKLVAEKRNESAITDRNAVSKILTNLAAKFGSVKVKAKDEGEKIREYNLVDSVLTRKADLNFDNNVDDIKEEIYNKIKITYEQDKKEILKYVNKNEE